MSESSGGGLFRTWGGIGIAIGITITLAIAMKGCGGHHQAPQHQNQTSQQAQYSPPQQAPQPAPQTTYSPERPRQGLGDDLKPGVVRWAEAVATRIDHDTNLANCADALPEKKQACELGAKGSNWIMQASAVPHGMQWCIEGAKDDTVFKDIKYLRASDDTIEAVKLVPVDPNYVLRYWMGKTCTR